MIRAIQSPAAQARLREARAFVDRFPPGQEVLLLGASRGAVDDFARAIAVQKNATFGLHRLSFTQLAARIASFQLASTNRAPSTALGHEAVATRAAFEAQKDDALEYFAPVARMPGFPKALARTLLELRLASAPAGVLRDLPRSGPDLAELLGRVEELLADAAASDRAALFDTAAGGLRSPDAAWPPMPALFLDVPFDSDAEARFLWALAGHCGEVLLTVPTGDSRTIAHLARQDVRPDVALEVSAGDLGQLTRHLFSTEPPPERERTGELVWFSAPGEGRECVEIARRLLKEAARGVRFDETAILVRSPQQYLGVLEHALARAGIPAYFDRGTRRPHPAGRAFLAILTCAAEHFSANRFAEYLSLGQVPQPGQESGDDDSWVSSTDEVFGRLSEPLIPNPKSLIPAPQSPGEGAVIEGTLRTPWKWESLLVESAVIGGAARWARRLNGLDREFELRIAELRSEESDSPKIARLERERTNLEHLRSFALPLIERMAAWPDSASWGDWLQRLEHLAPKVLKQPADVLRVLADLRPMGAVGPVSLEEVRDVLADRLMSLEVDPPSHRYGRVFIGSPHQARGREFRCVFVPGLAERLFPQKLREDPLLLDDLRKALGADLSTQDDRNDLERLLLRLAAGAATERLYVSFPRIETAEARQRVPSFYALEVMRAVTGRIPEHQALEAEAASESKASLAWPAPFEAADAIDDFEHDLSVLRALMRAEEPEAVKGHAHYMLRLNECLRRSATERWARSQRSWSQFDGIVRVTEKTKPFLESQRLGTRAYSVSALQNFSYCPYRFLLSALYRLEPLVEPEPLQRLDPLTKGSLFHEVQAEFYRALQKNQMPLERMAVADVLATLDATLARIEAKYAEQLAPAVDRVWRDEVDSLRTDLHVWARKLVEAGEWEPWMFEYAFGLPHEPSEHVARDPQSRPDPVTVDGRFLLRGSIDLVEKKRGTNILRVTDHKTSRNRSERNALIGGGKQLQPVIYSLAIESATGCTVESARFSYCTTAGGFTEHSVPIVERTRRMGVEVLEIVDRAIETGMLPAAPDERACRYCDFVPVCGPDQDRRIKGKLKQPLGDLVELRSRP